MDGDLIGAPHGVNDGVSTRNILKYISVGAGLLMLFAGLYLGFVAFNEARSLIRDPSPLERWAKLAESIQPNSAAAGSTTTRPSPGLKPESSHDKRIRVLGGYAMLFLGLLFVWIMAKVASTFVVQGASILLKAADKK